MSEQYISLAEVRDLLTAENERRELLTTQKAAMEHARAVSILTLDQTKALIAEVGQVPGVTDSIAVKIADLLPKASEDVRAIVSKERLTLEPSVIDNILEIVAKYL